MAFITFFLSLVSYFGGANTTATRVREECVIVQNLPSQVGDAVTFTLQCLGEEAPNVAWNFGDGSGLGPYVLGASATHTYKEPGVYRVMARIQGEEYPVFAVQTVVNPIQTPRPTNSSTIAIDHARDLVYAVNPDNNLVAKIDAVSLEKVAEIQVGRHPRTVAVGADGRAWVTNEDDASITVIDINGDVQQKVSLPYASRPYGICLDPQNENVYVTLQATGKLLRISAKTGEITGTAGVGYTPRGIAISSDGQRVLVTRFISPQDQGEITEVNGSTMQVQRVIPLAFDETPDFDDNGRGVPNYISSITISPDGQIAWVPAKKDNVGRGIFRDGQALTFENTVRTIAARLDLNTNEEVLQSRIDFNDSDMACAVAFSPYGNLAFTAMQGNNAIHVVDVYTNARIGSITNTGLAPQGLVFNADGSKLFVQNFMSRTVRVYDTEDLVMSLGIEAPVLATIQTVEIERLSSEVLLGKQIFYNAADPRMTFAGYISCASCHVDGGSDERVWDFTDRGEGFRNTSTLLGKGGVAMGNVHWTGNFNEIQDFENDIRQFFRGKGFIPDEQYNAGTVNDPMGDNKAGLSPDLDASAAYVSSLDKVHPSPYRNPDSSLTAEAVEGKAIFRTLGCGTCHTGPDFTDRATGVLHDVGTMSSSSGKRVNQTLNGIATPTLRGIWETAPYLHDGSAPTLRDVLVTRNSSQKHGATASLSEDKLSKLISFLQQIDDSKTGVLASTQERNNQVLALTAFPNPATEYIKFSYRFQSHTQDAALVIYNAAGKMVYTGKIKRTGGDTSLNTERLASGVYTAVVIEKNSKATLKFVFNK